ncbi:1-phosphofructokinase family hexose kinase [Leisingera sp. McT4-56]|uniref:1-phosphofructokinase family hexose kinase n=1 Tax=Leisingera sp. McT4-56 TaxID=2881255 RepID=UPI001CF8C97B|nr:hexose kinase [Leisingera sp. McT4-56]MCB4457913.1 1-phosphofructokinase family hexose kinase [Leisingera sp. McT4-56]
MSGILTITLNPAVDLATSIERVAAGPKLYCKAPRVDPGGGGVNAARAIRKLGGQVTALVAVGGAMGEQLLQLLAAEDVLALAVHVAGETRQSFAVTDETTGEQFRFSVPGETMDSADGARLLSAIAQAAPRDGYAVLSGGVTPGLDDDFPQQVLAAVAPRRCKLVVDTSKAALAHLLAAPGKPVHVLRLDQREAEQAAGHELATVADSLAFAQDLIARGVADIVAGGRGAEGSVLATRDQRFFCRAPYVEVQSKIGAGDAFTGALTLALSRGEALDQALRWGVAAASATVGTEGTALFGRGEVEALLPQCEVAAA